MTSTSQISTPAAPVFASGSVVSATVTDPWLRRLLAGIVTTMTAVVIVVAALAFVASFGAIHQFASRSGGITPGYAWMAPLFVDSFVFVGACGDLWCALTRTDAYARSGWEQVTAWAPKLLLVAAAAGSYALNVAHAPPTAPARAVAALPPTALVVTEIVLMVIVRRAARYRLLRLAVEQTQPDQPTRSDTTQPDTATARDLRAETRQLVAASQVQGQPISGAELARQLGTSAVSPN